jgi:hypothetical protein
MLKTAELQAAREKLNQARLLVAEVRDLYFSDHDVSGARLLNEVHAALDDEIAALAKKIGEGDHA